MSSVLRISEAATIGFHAMVLLASNGSRHYSTRDVAKFLSVSEWHLSKVLQRLTRSGIVRSVKGSGGGYALARKGSDITLLDILEAIDGPFKPDDCLMKTRRCRNRECIMGDLLSNINKEVREFMKRKRLSDFENAVFVKGGLE